MATQSIIFTALPHGFTGRTLKLSVFVSPRLTPDAPQKLQPFTDFLNWPDRVRNGLAFAVEFQGLGGPVGPLKIKLASRPQEDLWKHLFNANTYVKGFVFKDLSSRMIYSYPVANVLGYLKDVYTAIAETNPTVRPTAPNPNSASKSPTSSPVDKLIGDIGGITPGIDRYSKQLDDLMQRPSSPAKNNPPSPKALNPFNYPASISPFTSQTELEFYQANRFYDRPGFKKGQYDTTFKFPPVVKPKPDFHEMLATTGDYPEVMRRLGIVIDLEIDVPMSVNLDMLLGASAIRVKPQWTKPQSPLNQTVDQPWTWLEKGRFMAAPDPSKGDLSQGMLRLNNADAEYRKEKTINPYALVMLDPDGAVLKAIHFAGNMQRLNVRRSYAEPDDAAVPSLRSPGIGIVKLGRAYSTGMKFIAAAQKNTKLAGGLLGGEHFYHDDLLRGYRVDVYDGAGGKWRSLCKRIGDYRFPGGTPAVKAISDELATVKDEGYIKGGAASSDLNNSPDLYLHESLFRWDGWSLVAPHPGSTILRQTADPTQPPEVPARIPNKAATEFQMEVEFKVQPGTLPRLRYGHKYRMRARAVDLSGFSYELDEAPKDPTLQTNVTPFFRFEVVIPPAVLLRAKMTPGESVEHLVIRSNYDVTTGEYMALPAVQSALAGKDYAFTEISSRHAAPPKIAEFQAEVHSMFDDNFGEGKDCNKSYLVALKEEGSFMDTMIVDTTTGAKSIPVTGIELVTPASVATSPTPPTLATLKPGDALATGQYIIHKEEKLLLPYLPDPFARGVTFIGVPRSNSSEILHVIKVPFTGAPGAGNWPDYTPFRIEISERKGKMNLGSNKCQEDFDDDGRPVWDKTNRVLRVFLGKGEIARILYGSYLNDPDVDQMGLWDWLKNSAKKDELRRLIVTGLHWMFTPFREMTLVHAVQQPLCEPTIDDKQFFAKKSEIGQTFARITGMFHLSVKSTGRIDLMAAWDEAVDNLVDPGPKTLPGNAHVFDFKIEESFPDDLPIPVVQGDPDKIFRHEFHDTKHRLVNYHLIGATRFREYFPAEITQNPQNITREGPVHQYRVLNSARPAAPKILYVVPTFGWSKEVIDKNIVSRRCGGLRVYMDRPWYSTGDEERLGVVLRAGAGGLNKLKIDTGVINKLGDKLGLSSGSSNGGPTDPLKPFVTDWGMDPIWGSALPKPVAQRTDFPLSDDTSRGGLTLAELDGVTVDVAAHPVDYDETRGLWYCDIAINAGDSYTPFVRLGLARFQPYSLNDCHLSRVAMTDFAQIAPDRVAAIVFDSPTKLRVMVSGVYGINQITEGNFDPKKFDSTKPETYNALGYSRAFVASVERRADIASLSLDGKGTPMWAPVPGNLGGMMTPLKQKDNTMIWSVEITLPEPSIQMGGTKQYRIVVKEVEVFRTDNDVKMVSLNDQSVAFRIVYVDTIEI